MHQYTVSESCDLFSALCQLFPQSSKTTLRSWLKEGRVVVNGSPVKIGSHPIKPMQKIGVARKQLRLPSGMTVLFADDHLLAIDKPAGLLSVATAFEKERTAHALLRKEFHPRSVEVVHRLDQETSGVMLFALSKRGKEGLKALFYDHTIERRYAAIIEGTLPQKSGSWRSYLFEDRNYYVHASNRSDRGQLAITHYKTVATTKNYSKLDLTLETGRKNQIRVHCAEQRCPIAGDSKYGAVSDPIGRLALHAYHLSFFHPVTGKRLTFASPLPNSFAKFQM